MVRKIRYAVVLLILLGLMINVTSAEKISAPPQVSGERLREELNILVKLGSVQKFHNAMVSFKTTTTNGLSLLVYFPLAAEAPLSEHEGEMMGISPRCVQALNNFHTSADTCVDAVLKLTHSIHSASSTVVSNVRLPVTEKVTRDEILLRLGPPSGESDEWRSRYRWLTIRFSADKDHKMMAQSLEIDVQDFLLWQ